ARAGGVLRAGHRAGRRGGDAPRARERVRDSRARRRVEAGERGARGAREERRAMPREVASVLADVLADKDARLASFGERSALELPFAVAAKTGTSKGY